MKNHSTALLQEGSAQMQASKAIQQINKIIEKRYPVLNSVGKSRLLVECLIELAEERRYVRTQRFLP